MTRSLKIIWAWIQQNAPTCALVKTRKMIHLTLKISIKNSKEEAILGLAIDNKLSFNNHGRKICRKASQNLCTFKNIKFRLETRKKFF